MQDRYIKEKISGEARYQSFFTDASELNNLMVSLLGETNGKRILEPCAGHGAFIDPLLGDVGKIHAVDIDDGNVEVLSEKYGDRVQVQKGDFIDYFVETPPSSGLKIDSDYDGIICNPPYGLKFSIPYRKKIKDKFPNIYARESYGLFMTFGIQCLKAGGRFVFIVPDTFLTSRNHQSLRLFLRDNTDITHIVQFNSARFETVNFGYGNLCIIAGNRSTQGQSSEICWLDWKLNDAPLTRQSFTQGKAVAAKRIRNDARDGWAHSEMDAGIFITQTQPLGELAECRTGIYTGDNLRFCAYDEENPPSRVNGHPIRSNQVRLYQTLTETEREFGIVGEPYFVPFVRGGHRAPFEKTRSAINWSVDAVNYYRTDKKARLQNSRFYFRCGLAVPMVTSGRLSASYLEGAIFDQGVVGIFPKNELLVKFLLIFLNSQHATDMKLKIMPGANNSANYLKRLNVPLPDESHLMEAEKICERWKHEKFHNKEDIRQEATAFIDRNFLPAKVAA